MANTNATPLSNPKPRDSLTKFFSVARTDTTAALQAKLPKGSLITGMYVIGAAASDAQTTAVISVGTTVTANELMASYDVKTAATGEGYNIAGAAAVGSAFASKLTVDTPVYAVYAETGTASTTGGPWVVKLEYFLTGPNETL